MPPAFLSCSPIIGGWGDGELGGRRNRCYTVSKEVGCRCARVDEERGGARFQKPRAFARGFWLSYLLTKYSVLLPSKPSGSFLASNFHLFAPRVNAE